MLGLRVVLASAVFFPVTAARGSLNEDRFVSTVEKLGSLLQSHGYADSTVQSLAAQAITPGAKASLDAALKEVINQLEEKVITKIKGFHDKTQVAINEAIGNLQASTQAAIQKKEAADNADQTWVDCVEQEKAAAKAIETARGDKQQAEAAVTSLCKRMEDRDNISMNQTADQMKFECDISKIGNCDAQVLKYEAQIDSMMSTMTTNVAGHVKSWTEANIACTAAKTELTSKTNALLEREEQWAKQRKTCNDNHATRVMSMCAFGTKFNMKCFDVSNYQNLSQRINESGDEMSDPDRVKEWKTVGVTKCMLLEITQGKDIDAAALSQCEAQSDAASFAKNVGVLDTKGGVFQDETTTSKFTCSEQTLKFHGQTWDMSATEDGSKVASAAYVKKAAKETAVDVTPSGTRVDFCSGANQRGSQQSCKTHTCKFGKVTRLGFVCAANCTDEECCNEADTTTDSSKFTEQEKANWRVAPSTPPFTPQDRLLRTGDPFVASDHFIPRSREGSSRCNGAGCSAFYYLNCEPGKYAVFAHYASWGPRPLSLSIDEKAVGQIATEAIGTWSDSTMQWALAAMPVVVPVQNTTEHTVRLDSHHYFPHISAVAFIKVGDDFVFAQPPVAL